LVGCTDSDFADDNQTAKNTTGCMLDLHGAAIFWASKRQSVVLSSTCEAEYITVAFGAKEVASWLRSVPQHVMRYGLSHKLRVVTSTRHDG
jgi:hypothetical protein